MRNLLVSSSQLYKRKTHTLLFLLRRITTLHEQRNPHLGNRCHQPELHDRPLHTHRDGTEIKEA